MKLNKLLIIVLLSVASLSVKAQTDSTRISWRQISIEQQQQRQAMKQQRHIDRMNNLNAGTLLRQATTLEVSAASIALVGGAVSGFLLSDNTTSLYIGMGATFAVSATLAIAGICKIYKAAYIIEHLHPIPNGIAFKF